jgi:hypothetical protein
VNFKDYFNKKSIEPTKKRHMHPIGRDVSSHPLTPGKFVPDMHRTIHKNQKLNNLMKQQTGKVVLSKKDIAQIEQEFPPLRFDPSKPKKIGNTGVTLKFDASMNRPIIEK